MNCEAKLILPLPFYPKKLSDEATVLFAVVQKKTTLKKVTYVIRPDPMSFLYGGGEGDMTL